MDYRTDKEKINDVWHCSGCDLAVVIDDKRVSIRTTIGGALTLLIAILPFSFLLKLLSMFAVFAVESYKFFSWVQYKEQLSGHITKKEQAMEERKDG